MLTPCLGRADLLQQLASALGSARWVTVVGPPGSGKTLVARHATAEHAGTVWVSARGLRSTEAVVDACLDQLGSEPAPGDSRVGTLSRALDGTNTVLVLDGVEVETHTLGPTCQQVVETTTDARIVVTSLTLSGQPAERVVRVGPLPLPSPGSRLTGPAVELLLGRVEQAGGHPVDTVQHEQQVRRLLDATGGLPLLIEQVAVQSALVGLNNVVPASSFLGTVAASYELLDDETRRLFRRAALLPAPASADVLAEVAEVSPARASELAVALVRRSLLEVLPDGRFDMLTPIRELGRELAGGEEEAALVRAAVLRWADRVAPDHFNFGAADAPWLVDLPVMRTAVLDACADPASRDTGYQLANRIFSSLYTSMRAREAVEILEGTLKSGDGPADIGAQVARRAGIAASEVRGTYEGMWLLDRADEHAVDASDPSGELARTASIRAEMHLDAGDLEQAYREARRAIDVDPEGSIVRQAIRTIVDVHVSSGRFREAAHDAGGILAGSEANDERWISLSARTLLGLVALEQGRPVEATAVFRAVVQEGREIAEDRVALLAETLLRDLDPDYEAAPVDRDSLPWAVRLPVLAQDARDLFSAGDVDRASGLAADVVALADSSRLGRTAVEARLLLGRALLAQDDPDQAASTFLAALERGAAMPMPLRVADTLDGLAEVARTRGNGRDSRQLAAAAAAIRVPRQAVRWGYADRFPVAAAASAPAGWVGDGGLTPAGLGAVTAVFADNAPKSASPLDVLTPAEQQVAARVADGLTSRRIAEELFVSPRTVDAHLTHIYRKLDINTRAKLAAIVTDHS